MECAVPFRAIIGNGMAPLSEAVDVWLTRTDVTAATLAGMADVLNDEERARAARFHFHDDRARSIVARAALRHLLGHYLDRDPRALRFVTGPQGKPALDGGDLEFNVSHSGERVAIAVASATPVGIDIEQARVLRDANAVARRFFSPNEAAAVERDPSRFLSIWTAKESVIKAIGGGLSIDLSSFEAFATAGRFAPVTNLSAWSVMALPLADGYRSALAARGAAWTVAVREWSL